MADLDGAWTPESDAGREFLIGVNSLAAKAYEEGVAQEDIVGGLAFTAAVISMQEPDEDVVDVPEGPDRVQACPECGDRIENVVSFIGGTVIVQPCGCRPDIDAVAGWVEGYDAE